ncbi:hypothetical protein BC6307_07525 [Sutcliffiella cohnii]|uniref:CopC domain-containing protein n=1 Tax=Sutcliffiella cohnii TaxID=33932 RepID=A0A223KNW9_9BACI|nr:copper resistance protein CopC [Sutcliffiella cohnii]AST91139.1 hypothetical protein BC6307_07525 [Sutcliffiella cohnii]
MKRIITIATTVLLVLTMSKMVLAHSHFVGSNPSDGEVLTESLQEIVLEFDGNIEQGSYIDLATTAGETVEVQDHIIEENMLTGTLASPLENGDYDVNWSVISADGHPLEGSFSFTVNAPVAEPEVEEQEEITEDPAETPETTDEATDQDVAETEEEIAADEANEGSSSMMIILIVLLVAIIAGGFFFLAKKRK